MLITHTFEFNFLWSNNVQITLYIMRYTLMFSWKLVMAVELKLFKLVFMVYKPPRDLLWKPSVLEELTCLVDAATSFCFFVFQCAILTLCARKPHWFVNSPLSDLPRSKKIKLGTTSKPCYTFINWRLSLIDKVSPVLAPMGLLFSSPWIIATFDTALDDWWEILQPGGKAKWKINGFNAAAIVMSKHHIYLLIFDLLQWRSISVYMILVGLDLSFQLFASICLTILWGVPSGPDKAPLR